MKTPEQKRLDKLEGLVNKLVNTNSKLMSQSDAQQRELRRLKQRQHSLESQISQMKQRTT